MVFKGSVFQQGSHTPTGKGADGQGGQRVTHGKLSPLPVDVLAGLDEVERAMRRAARRDGRSQPLVWMPARRSKVRAEPDEDKAKVERTQSGNFCSSKSKRARQQAPSPPAVETACKPSFKRGLLRQSDPESLYSHYSPAKKSAGFIQNRHQTDCIVPSKFNL